jgi:hypothetical protein
VFVTPDKGPTDRIRYVIRVTPVKGSLTHLQGHNTHFVIPIRSEQYDNKKQGDIEFDHTNKSRFSTSGRRERAVNSKR